MPRVELDLQNLQNLGINYNPASVPAIPSANAQNQSASPQNQNSAPLKQTIIGSGSGNWLNDVSNIGATFLGLGAGVASVIKSFKDDDNQTQQSYTPQTVYIPQQSYDYQQQLAQLQAAASANNQPAKNNTMLLIMAIAIAFLFLIILTKK